MKAARKPERPFPPTGMGTFDNGVLSPSFIPAAEVGEWSKKHLLTEGAALYNPEHKHLEFADIAFLWASGGYVKQMRQVIGQCEEVTFRCSAWQKGRQEQQMSEWFGNVPTYLITLDAEYCAACSDLEFCALVEHELYHIGHQKDRHGQPSFTRDGLPKLAIRGHDVEEFVGIVQRYGVGDPDGQIAKMIKAAKEQPAVGRVNIAQACGTCLLKAA